MRLRLLRNLAIAAAALVVLAIGLWRLSSLPCFQLIGELHCRVETDQRVVALTFDDGPVPEGVDMILPLLEREQVKGTFFLVGEVMEEHPGLARKILDAGHELGNHSYTHRRLVGRLPATYREEVERTDALLRAEGVAQPTLFRPPYGRRLVGLPWAVDAAGYRTITWDVEEPFRLEDPQAYADHILERVKPGSIILMHPMYYHREIISKAFPIIAAGLKERGYRMVTVSELLALEGEMRE